VTTAADLIAGLGDPLNEIIHLEFQSSAAAWKHADLMVYNALLFAHYHVPVHTVVILLRPEAAHANMNGTVAYAPRPERGKMDFSYECIRLWERAAEELLSGDLGVAPLAMLGRLRKASAAKIFRGVRAMQESDTYLMILDEGQEKALREAILVMGEDYFGPPDEGIKAGLNSLTDLSRLKRILRRTPKAASWHEILETP
jgi:hypothetical protein